MDERSVKQWSRSKLSLPEGLYGHSKPGAPLSEWQRLDEHLDAVARMAASFAEDFDSDAWAFAAGILHDVGKLDRRFQAYLRSENEIDDKEYDDPSVAGKVNHSSAGAALAERLYSQEGRPLGRILSYMVAGHHAGLPDYGIDAGARSSLPARLEDGQNNLGKIEHMLGAIQEILPSQTLRLPTFVKEDNVHFWIRMLFSCLVDSDFLDTESFMSPERSKTRPRRVPLTELKDQLDQFLADVIARGPDTPVNRARREVLTQCRARAKESGGVFSLEVPTGGGKTLSALAFALDHAVCRNKHRVIYVIPYTGIIEQTSDVLKRIFGSEVVVEHHSNLDPGSETLRSALAAENWDAPIVVTTSVQFFESLYAARPGRCRKLHNLVNSVVILDEAQLIPPEKLAPCQSALIELAKNYGCSMVLSTATQPVLKDLFKQLPVCKIAPTELNLHERLNRVMYEFPSGLGETRSWEDLAGEMMGHRQVLCVVNSRRDCYELFRHMPAGTLHLSTLMCGEHRSAVIQGIKAALQNREEIRVVSTQLVEAGVDIDFPVVYRALCGLDSIVQSAGRCNREGRLPGKGVVKIFVPESKVPVGLLRKGESASRELFACGDLVPDSPLAITRYFELFYSSLNDNGKRFLDSLRPNPKELDISFRSVAADFRMIDDSGRQSVFVRFGEGEGLIDQLRRGGPQRDLLRRMQRYCVSLHRTQLAELRSLGYVEEVWPGFLAQSAALAYDSIFGLQVFDPCVKAEDLVV